MRLHAWWCSVIFALAIFPVSRSDNILAIVPLDIASHQRFSQPILRELTKRHHVTVITPVEDPNPPPNYKQIVVPRIPLWDAVETNNNESMLTHKKSSYRLAQNDLKNRTFTITDAILSSNEMKDFVKNDKTKYDLIIMELFHTEAFYIFAHIHDAPIVGLSSFGHAHFINQIMGNPLELSYVAHENLQLPKRFKVFDRLQNTIGTIADSWERNSWVDSEQEGLVKKHFPHLKEPLPNLRELEKKVDLVLVNSHFAIDTSRPLVPGIVEVGGLHVKKAENLSKEIELFLHSAQYGAAYVRFENDAIKSEICPTRVKLFLRAFKKLQMKIVWAWDGEKPIDLPNNVMMINASIPMSDILGFKQIQLLITHGGQIHIQEAISKTVPVLCIPLYGDQISTCSKAVQDGYAKELDLDDITEDVIASSVIEVAEGSRILEATQMANALFEDRLNPPISTATYWIEYATKGKSKNIKSPAVDLPLYEYYMLDTAAIIFLALYYFFKLIWWLFWNVVLRKKIPRDDLQPLIEKYKAQ